MKNLKFEKLEALARSGFRLEKDFTVPENWREKVIFSIKRYERKGDSEVQAFIQPRLVWRFTMAAVAVATLICLALYLSFPEYAANDSQTYELVVDNFDNYIQTIAQL